MNRIIQFMLAAIFSSLNLPAQNIAINNDGTPPHSSAILDVKSGTKGFLLPRMDSNARKNILSPAKGLMVFDTSDNNLWQHNGNAWGPYLKLPGTYTFNYNGGDVLSITNNGSSPAISANCTYGGGTALTALGGRYGLFSKSDNGTGSMSSVGVVGTYYGGYTLNGNYYPSTGGIGVLALGGGGFGPSFSLNAYHFGLFASAKDYGIYSTALPGGIAAQFKGQTWMQGTQHYSHFNYGSNEDTYIRGGKDNAAVVIADALNQKATVGTGLPNGDAKLTVDDPNNTLYSGVNATSNGIFKDTFSISGYQYEINDHRPAVKAIGAYGGNALEIDGQVAVSGNNKFVFDVYPQNTDINAMGYFEQSGSYWYIRLNHTILDDIMYNTEAIFVTPYFVWADYNETFAIPSRHMLWYDTSHGMWKYVMDIPPVQTFRPIIRLKVMVIRTNPGSRPIN